MWTTALISQGSLSPPWRKGRWLSFPLTWPGWTVDRPQGSLPRHPGLQGPQWTETEIKPGKAALLPGLALKAHCGALHSGWGRERAGLSQQGSDSRRGFWRNLQGKGLEGRDLLQQVHEQPLRARSPRRRGQRAAQLSSRGPGTSRALSVGQSL